VHQNNRRGSGNDRAAKYLPCVDEQGIHRSDGDKLMAPNSATCVQDEHREALAVRIELR
jgi:hypothetical protein